MADQEARDELRRLVDAAAGRLLDAGCSWDEVVAVIGRRLGPLPVAERPEYGIGPVDPETFRREREGRWPDPEPPAGADSAGPGRDGPLVVPDTVDEVRLPDDADRYPRATVVEAAATTTRFPVPAGRREEQVAELVPAPDAGGQPPLPQAVADALVDDVVRSVAEITVRPATTPEDRAEARAFLDAARARGDMAVLRPDEPGEPPVGSVVTDTRSRVCWREQDGWHRADVPGPISWADVVQAYGGPAHARGPAPGQPTVITAPPARLEVPTVTRPAGRMQMQVQKTILGPDGEPVMVKDGQPKMETVTETVEISEVVPAPGGQP